jgi:hypothetical protein
MSDTPLISDEYRRLQSELHRNPAYGSASQEYAKLVAGVMTTMGTDELLDYGAGKGRLGAALEKMLDRELDLHHYDPAIPEWSEPPAPCRLVACIDVLEHIEPELIDNVLDDLQRVTIGLGIFSVHMGPALKTLADGRNAHLIQQPAEWWRQKFLARFDVKTFNVTADICFYVIVGPKTP